MSDMIKGGVVNGEVTPVFRQAESSIGDQDLVPVPDKLKRGNTKNLNVFMPRKQIVAHTDPLAVSKISYTSTTTNLLTTQSFDLNLTRGSVDIIRGPLAFQFRLTCATLLTVIAPTPFWFERVEMRLQGGSYCARTWYPDVMYFNQLLFAKKSNKYRSWAKYMSMGDNLQSGGGRRDEIAGRLQVGQTRDFWLFLPDGVFDNTDILMPVQNQDIQFRFYMKNTSGSAYTVSGTYSNVTCTEFALHIPERNLDPTDLIVHQNLYQGRTFGHNYLDNQLIELFNQGTSVFAAGQTINIDLSNFNGLSAMILAVFRNVGGPITAASDQYINSIVDLGDDCTFDIKENNNSLYGNGIGVKGGYIRNILAPQLFDGLPFNNVPVYPLVFAQDIRKSYNGILNGYLDFNPFKSKKVLSIVLPSAGVKEIQTITQAGGAAGAGFIYLSFRGYLTEGLAHSTSAANLAVAFNALPSMLNAGLTAAFSAAFSASATVTVTFTGNGCQPVESLVGCILGLGVTTATNATTAITTVAVPGFTSATNHYVTLYNYFHKDLYDQGGFLSAQPLGNDAQSVFQY